MRKKKCNKLSLGGGGGGGGRKLRRPIKKKAICKRMNNY